MRVLLCLCERALLVLEPSFTLSGCNDSAVVEGVDEESVGRNGATATNRCGRRAREAGQDDALASLGAAVGVCEPKRRAAQVSSVQAAER